MKDNVYTNVEKKNYMMEGTGVTQFSKALVVRHYSGINCRIS